MCRHFHIPWSEYGGLTVRERDTLMEMLAEEAKELEDANPKPGRPGMERVV